MDAGTITFHQTETSVKELLSTAAAPLLIPLELRDIQYHETIEPKDFSFSTDLRWTAEALGNILKNCMEHTPAGGAVTLSAWEDALAFRVRVDDTGPGIAKADLPHIFERFYRGPGDASPAGGVGIGLALAQGLVSAQGGSLRADNAPGGGARFDFAFFKTVV